MAGKNSPLRGPAAALRMAHPLIGRHRGERPELRVIAGTALAGVLAAMAALSLAAAVDEWPIGLILAALALLVSAGVIALRLLQRTSAPAVVDKALLIAAMESDDVGRVITDREGRLVSANHVYRRLCFGRVPAPADLGRADFDNQQVLTELQEALAVDGKGSGFLEIASRGRKRRLELTARTFGLYILWEVRQADTHVLLQEATAEMHTRLRPLMESLGLGFLVRNELGQVEYISDTARAILKVPVGKSVRLRWADISTEGAKLTTYGGSEVLEVETSEFDVPGRHGSGPVGTLVLLRDAAPTRTGVAKGTGRGERSVTAILEDAPLGVAIVDSEARIQEYNAAFADLFQSARGEPPEGGEALDALVPKIERAEFQMHVRNTAAGDPPRLPMEVRLGPDEDAVAQVFFGVTGEGSGQSILYVIDATQQKSLEIQFAQAQKMQAVGQLAGGIAHDFNNLLTAIIGFCDLLLVRHGPGDQSFSDLMQIKQNANRAANLVRQLLAFSRRQTLRPKIVAVTDVLAEISNLVRRLIGERIELRMVHGRDLGPVKVDQGQLEQVIINLAVNARDAMPGGGLLTVSTNNVAPAEVASLGYRMMPEDQYVLISVADNGTGIPEADLDKVFEPFFTTKEVGKGTGLGLSTVYGIVKQTGGFIFARNAESGGAIFDIFLPVHQTQPEAVAPGRDEKAVAATRDLTGKETIVIAEDEDAVRLFAARALTNKGYTVMEYPSGESALEALKGHDGEIGLLISDVIMPGMDGPTLVDEARKHYPNLKTILISGYAEEAIAEKMEEGDYAFLPKPFSLQELAERVKEVLEG